MNILITGATGNVGTPLVEILKTSYPSFYQGVSKKAQENPEARKIFVDYGDKYTLEKAFTGIDTLFLLFPMVEEMVTYAKNCLDAAKVTGVKHIVRSSGMGSNIQSPYKLSQMQGIIDDSIKSSGIAYTIIKPANFMQNFTNSFASSIKQEMIYNSTAEGKLAFVDVEDIARVSVEILLKPEKHKNKEYNITGDQLMTFTEAVEIISKSINKEIKVVDISIEQAEEGMVQMGFPRFVVDILTSLNTQIKSGEFNIVNDAILEITHRKPISFEEFATKHKAVWL